MLRNLPFFFLLFLFIFACNSPTSSPDGKKAKDMSDFADDKEFQNAHEEPESLDLSFKGEMIEFATDDGAKGSAYSLKSAEESAKYLFVVHEWWGLNDHIKREAERLYESIGNINVLALDLYDGKVATTREDAGKYMEAATEERASSIIRGALAIAGASAEIATVGWCFGGGWSLKSSILAGEQGVGCVIYYGMPVDSPEALAPLQADVLGIFAEQDGWITPEVVDNFSAMAKGIGKKVETHQFKAEHAFANPSSPRYNEEAAQSANELALNFLKEKLQ